MRSATLCLLLLVLVATFAFGCSDNREPAVPSQPVQTQKQLSSFFVTMTPLDGIVPNSLVVLDGAVLQMQAFDATFVITDANGKSTTVPAGETVNVTVRPRQPGVYSLTCDGCPAGKNTLSITVR